MVEDPEQSDVRITAPRRSSGSNNDSSLRSGPRIQTPNHVVVVPVTDTLLETYTGINVRRFLQTAVALAADNDGRVLLLGIETVSSEAALETVREHIQPEQPTGSETDDPVKTIEERRTQVAEIAAVAAELSPSVPVNAVVRAVTDVTKGVLDVIDGGGGTTVLLLRGSGLDESWLLNRSTVDAVLADAECDVFVENLDVQRGENALYVPDVEEHTVASLANSAAETIDSILLPVGTGPHSALAAEAARAVARDADAPVTVLHVISPDAPAGATADGKDLLKFAEYVLGADVTTETELREAFDTTDAIVQEAKAHDFVSIGAPEQKFRLGQLVFEPVQQTLSALREPTILMSRDADRTMRSLYYRWKRGINAMEDDSESAN